MADGLPVAGVQMEAQGNTGFLSSIAASTKAVLGFGSSATTAATQVATFDSATRQVKVDQLTSKLDLQKKELALLQQELTKTSTRYGESSTQAQRKQLAIDKLSAAISTTETKLLAEQKALQGETQATEASAQASAKAEAPVRQLGGAAQHAGEGFSAAQGRISAFGEIVIGALRHIGEIAVDAFARAGKAVLDFSKGSISVAGDFEQGFAEFNIAVGHTIDGTGLKLTDFKKLFISLGKELPVSTAEVEKAAVEMARGGIDPATIAAGGLRQTIQFASAALKGDLTQAALISAKTMQAWTSITDDAKTKTEFLTHAQNLMTQATTAASTTVDQLFLGLSNVGGTARLAGVSFDETVKALAQLTPSFASSADAGTSFKTFLARLQPSTKPAIAAMQGLGLYTEEAGSAFYDANGKFIGMAKTEQLLQDATKDLTDAQRESILQTIFGQDSIRAAGVFAMQGAQGYDALSASIAKQTTLTDAAKINQATYNTALENAKGSFEALQITVGTAVLPVLTKFLNETVAPGVNVLTTLAGALTGDTAAFDALSPTMQTVAGIMQSAFGTIGTTVDTIHTFIDRVIKDVAIWESGVVGLPTILQSFGISPDAATLIDTVLTTLSDGFTTVAGVWTNTLQPALATAGAFITDNLTPILSGIAAVLITVAVPAFVTWAGAASTAAIATMTAMAPVVVAIAVIGVAVAVLSKAWQEDWGGIRTTLTDFWTTTGAPIFAEAVSWLQVRFPVAIQTVSQFWTGTLQPALATVWSFLRDKVIPVIVEIVGIHFASMRAGLTTLAGFWTNTLSPALNGVWSFLDKHVIPVFEALGRVVTAIVGPAVADFTTKLNTGLQPGLVKIHDAMAPLLPDMDNFNKGLDVIGRAISTTVGPALKSFGNDILKGIADWFGHIGQGLDIVSKKLNEFADFLSKVQVPDWLKGHSPPPMAQWFDYIAESVQAVAGQALPLFTGAVDDASEGVRSLTQNVKQPLTRALDGLGETLQSPRLVDSASQLGQLLMKSLAGGIIDGLAGVKDTLGTVNKQVQKELGKILGGGALSGGATGGDSQGNAVGGSIPSGEAHWVGEQGKELFMSAQPGYILPHDQSMRMVSPPASAAQIAAGGQSGGTTPITQQRVYNYAPTYGASPRAPSVDFAQMVAFGS